MKRPRRPARPVKPEPPTETREHRNYLYDIHVIDGMCLQKLAKFEKDKKVWEKHHADKEKAKRKAQYEALRKEFAE